MAYTDVGQACVGWIGLLAGTTLTTYYGYTYDHYDYMTLQAMDRAVRRPLLAFAYYLLAN